ncbi:hypothetical protein KEM54_001544 [Ascosphaera aggregata]|nr:hypothetical protein KEM54_001544 [Ascosphaera aggregata]
MVLVFLRTKPLMAPLNIEPTSDDAPPPYTPIDTTHSLLDSTVTAAATATAASVSASASPLAPAPVEGYLDSPLYGSSSFSNFPLPAVLPYVDVHGPSNRANGVKPQEIHLMIIYPRSQPRDYRRVPRCLRSGSSRISNSDWKAFLEQVFPSQLAPAAAQDQLPRHIRAQIIRDRKDCPQETDSDRRARIEAVVRDWNIFFFQPRNKKIDLQYIAVGSPPPENGLCPQCYPSSSKLMGSRRNVNSSPTGETSSTCAFSCDEKRPLEQRSSYDCRRRSEESLSSGTTSQIGTSLGDRIRDFAAQITEQAQQCSQRISAQAIVHGKWAEEQARAYGQLMERRTRSRQEWKQRRANFFEDMWDRYRGPFPASRSVPSIQQQHGDNIHEDR